MNIPTRTAAVMARAASVKEKPETYSRKPDLKISLKVKSILPILLSIIRFYLHDAPQGGVIQAAGGVFGKC